MNPLTLSRQRHGMLVECLAQRAQPIATSSHFTLYGIDPASTAAYPDDVVVVHDFKPFQIDNNIASYVANELLPLLADSREPSAVDGYSYSKQEIFERYVGEIVRSADGNERRAWHLFYDNTLAALWRDGPQQESDAEQHFIRDFGAIYRRVADLTCEVPHASVLDVATCFGFLPLLLSSLCIREGQKTSSIAGCDLNPALVALADDYARQRRLAALDRGGSPRNGARSAVRPSAGFRPGELAGVGTAYQRVLPLLRALRRLDRCRPHS